MTPIELVIARLQDRGWDPRQGAAGQWRSRCPCHKGQSSNLSVTEVAGGKVLLHCHHEEAGGKSCTAEQIVEALGLEMKDLFPPGDRPAAGAGKESEDGAGKIYWSAEKAAAAAAFYARG